MWKGLLGTGSPPCVMEMAILPCLDDSQVCKCQKALLHMKLTGLFCFFVLEFFLKHLLKSCVLDGVGVIVVIDDLKVTNGLTGARRCEMHFGFGLAGSLCVDGEVGWSSNLHS